MGTHFDGTAEENLALDCYIKLFRAADSVGQRINTHLRDHELTVSQFGALEAIYHLGAMQSGELGQKILKSSGNMTMVIDHLEKRGLVTRQRREDDRRCIDVHLTQAGHDLIATILPAHVAGVVETLAPLTAEEQQQLAALCRKLGLAQG
ncbi:MAG: MarR family transcriptional regulator [Ardenticatenaceae bacterium]|nr:MarR family transcriptional regulator [Anaerolineales bacterium]MCB8939615.1 MarR family transcriptional regulator [Ardenticatenaceae bacterium]MCB8974960.1 MarR family transcriptional regulator [Ardenticatenaceae bacterium]